MATFHVTTSRLAVAVVVLALAAIPVSLATAQGGDPGAASIDEANPTTYLPQGFHQVGQGETNVISDSPVPQAILDQCRANETYLCKVEEAKASGQLSPGQYTDSELDKALSKAALGFIQSVLDHTGEHRAAEGQKLPKLAAS